VNEQTTVTVTLHLSEQKELFRSLRALDELGLHYQVSSTRQGYKLVYAVTGEDGEPFFPPGGTDA
jgi:hypothetical protein